MSQKNKRHISRKGKTEEAGGRSCSFNVEEAGEEMGTEQDRTLNCTSNEIFTVGSTQELKLPK